MNWKQVESRWSRFAIPIRTEWRELTDDDLEAADGNRGLLAALIHERYGVPAAEADRQIEAWLINRS
ncbi:MAG: CsbD family protein [Bauldia sp.]